MNIVLAAYKYLSAQAPLVALLGHDDSFPVWMFQDKPLVAMEGTQSVLLVISSAGDWGGGSSGTSSVRYPRLQLTIFADPTRNAAGLVHYDDSRAKIEAVTDMLFNYLDLLTYEAMDWGGERVLGTRSDGEALYFPVADGDGVRRAQLSFSVLVG